MLSICLVAFVAGFAYSVAAASSAANENVTVTTMPSAPRDALQAEILSDGHVTHDELRAAYEQAVSCVQEAGFEAEITKFVPRFGAAYMTSGSTNLEADEADLTMQQCLVRYVLAVEEQYDEEHGLSSEEWAELHQGIADCLASEGIQMTDSDDDLEVLIEHPDVYELCEQEAIERFGSG